MLIMLVERRSDNDWTEGRMPSRVMIDNYGMK
jgi:hypothetical protein